MVRRHRIRVAAAGLVAFVIVGIFDGSLPFSRRTVTVLAAAPQATPLAQVQVPADPAARRARFGAVTLDALPAQPSPPGQSPAQGARIQLDLFPDVSIVALFDRFDPHPAGIAWVGHVEGVAGSTVTLVYGDGLMTGSVAMPPAYYTIRPAPAALRTANPLATGTLHVVTDVNQSAIRQEGTPIEVVIPEAAPLAADGRPEAQADSAAFIDLMVVYTPAARDEAGGASALLNLITLGISETNTAFMNSGVGQRLRLAHHAEVAYTETGSHNLDLDNLHNGTGAFSGIAALRNTHAADLVMLLQYSGGTTPCGLAYLMTTPSTAFESFAFSVVESDCVSPGYAFGHEIGHNAGLRHDWYVDSATTPYTYAHGHVSTTAGNRFRTIMSYSNQCDALGVECPRLLNWSNPNVSQGGQPTGIAAGTNTSCSSGSLAANTCDADSRLALDNTAPFVANFRQSSPAGSPSDFTKTLPAAGAIAQSTSATLYWQPSGGAVSYEYCYDTTNNNGCESGWVSAGAATSVNVTGLALASTYYWQARALNATGHTQADGGTWWSFDTLGAATFDPTLQVPTCSSLSSICDSGSRLRSAGTMDVPEINQPNTINDSCTDTTVGNFHFTHSNDRIRVFTVDGQPFAPGKTVTVEATVFGYDNTFDRLDLYYAANANAPSWTPLATLTPAGNGIQLLSTNYVLPVGQLQAVRARFRFGGNPGACVPGDYTDHDDLVFTVGPAPNTNFAQNGTFASGVTNWLQFGLPDASGIVSNNGAGGVFEFYRAGTQAVVFQQTGVPLGANAPILAQFDLGNTDSVRKRISVLLHDADFSDLSVCTFWLPAHAPLTTYSMRTHTTKTWANTTVSFYAASGGSGGVYRLDNVTVQHAPAQSAARTDCVDAIAPGPPGGSDGSDLLQNGSFSSGAVAPGWSTFGQIQSQVSGNVFEFIKLAGLPSGVLLQPTAQAMTANQLLTATFQLGNSSPVRKRVTVILHDNNFSDLSACTFWLAPGQPLLDYTYRTFATQAWTNATLSVYPATVGAHEWIRLDNVTFKRTPGISIVGTECIEPGGSADSRTPLPSWSEAARGTHELSPESGSGPRLFDSPERLEHTVDDVDDWTADGFNRDGEPSPEGLGPSWAALAHGRSTHTLTSTVLIDLTGASSARLALQSWLSTTTSRARVEVASDDAWWETVHHIAASDTWMPVEIDLDAYVGARIRVRLIFDGVTTDGAPPDALQVDATSIEIER